ncbi:hypothetical protein BHM03_00041844 [Ensete ventricosum]|nr:hypothetical protein BHM03_00041844 [Ensete ventricosum]
MGTTPVSGRPCRQQPWSWGCPLRPYSGQLPPAAWPWVLPTPASAAPARGFCRSRLPLTVGLTMASRRSYIPVFQIRMEKMKEVKCPL